MHLLADEMVVTGDYKSRNQPAPNPLLTVLTRIPFFTVYYHAAILGLNV